jgi:hypothetical protein
VGLVARTFRQRPSSLLLDPRPDAATRFEIDYLVASHWTWLEGKLHETKQVGSGKNAKTVPKYKLHDLLKDSPAK